MARKMYVHIFSVEGTGDFPTDMLRYDGCFPAHTEDGIAICPYFHEVEERMETRVVTLCHYGHGGWKPTHGRWASFGWHVRKHVEGSCMNT